MPKFGFPKISIRRRSSSTKRCGMTIHKIGYPGKNFKCNEPAGHKGGHKP